MTLLQSILSPRNATIESPAVPITSTTLLELFGGMSVDAGVKVSQETVAGIPGVWRAVTLIAGTAAALPLNAYHEQDDDSRIKLRTGAAADLLADPHPDQTAFEFWELIYGSLALHGNGYARKLRNSLGVLKELWWVAPSRVKSTRADDGTKLYSLDGDLDDPLTDREILHIPGFGYDGVCGVSAIRAHRQGFGLALAAEKYGAKLFGNGSLATGILQTDQRLDDTSAAAIKARWKARQGGLDNAHDIAVLDRNMKFQPLTINPEDAQFLDSRRFQVQEIARMFGVPPHLLMDTTTSTSWGTGLEQQTTAFVKFSLRPYWLTRVEQRLTKMLRTREGDRTPPSLRVDYVRYNLEALLRGDSAARAEFYKSLWELGVFSTNDIRRLEDMNPVDGGDARYVPLNFGLLGEQPQPAIEGVPADA